MLIDRGKHSLRLEYSKCNTENEANLLKGENTLLLISRNLHILRKPNLIMAQHQLYLCKGTRTE